MFDKSKIYLICTASMQHSANPGSWATFDPHVVSNCTTKPALRIVNCQE